MRFALFTLAALGATALARRAYPGDEYVLVRRDDMIAHRDGVHMLVRRTPPSTPIHGGLHDVFHAHTKPEGEAGYVHNIQQAQQMSQTAIGHLNSGNMAGYEQANRQKQQLIDAAHASREHAIGRANVAAMIGSKVLAQAAHQRQPSQPQPPRPPQPQRVLPIKRVFGPQ